MPLSSALVTWKLLHGDSGQTAPGPPWRGLSCVAFGVWFRCHSVRWSALPIVSIHWPGLEPCSPCFTLLLSTHLQAGAGLLLELTLLHERTPTCGWSPSHRVCLVSEWVNEHIGKMGSVLLRRYWPPVSVFKMGMSYSQDTDHQCLFSCLSLMTTNTSSKRAAEVRWVIISWSC